MEPKNARIYVKDNHGCSRFNVKAWKENNTYVMPLLIIVQEMFFFFFDFSRPVEKSYRGIV